MRTALGLLVTAFVCGFMFAFATEVAHSVDRFWIKNGFPTLGLVSACLVLTVGTIPWLTFAYVIVDAVWRRWLRGPVRQALGLPPKYDYV